jgi:protocatechuate 3,4-dioxygenase beta subunit
MNKRRALSLGLTRREFVVATGAGALTTLGIGAAGCDGAPALGAVDVPSGPAVDAASNPANDVAITRDASSAEALSPTCGELTEPSIEGPFFSAGSPERSNLRESGMTGTRLRLTGRVTAPDCTPLAGALLDFWQADADGAYDNVSYRLRGRQVAGPDGAFQLDTIIPGHYLNGAKYRPAHIHVKVGAKGHVLLTTQLYFEGDPFNETDGFIHKSLIMTLRDGADGAKDAGFDFVLTPA